MNLVTPPRMANLDILMPCCLDQATEIITTTLSPGSELATPHPMPRRLQLTSLPRELIDQILSNLTSSADLVCLALTHTLFLTIYRSRRASHIERTHDCVRSRLDRDIPVLYYCARCNCANIPCLSHVLDCITITSPPAAFRTDRAQHDAFMGFVDFDDDWTDSKDGGNAMQTLKLKL